MTSEGSQINNPMIYLRYLRVLGKGKQDKPKISRLKEIIKIQDRN
jgi:hypothetical protein